MQCKLDFKSHTTHIRGARWDTVTLDDTKMPYPKASIFLLHLKRTQSNLMARKRNILDFNRITSLLGFRSNLDENYACKSLHTGSYFSNLLPEHKVI